MFIYYGQGAIWTTPFSYRHSETLIYLANNCPEHMKGGSIKEKVLMTLAWISGNFGFILPNYYGGEKRSIGLIELSEKIAEVYSTEDPKIKYAIAFLKELNNCIV